MDWMRGEEQVSLVFEADDPRKLALRSVAAPTEGGGAKAVLVGCIALPFFAMGACLSSVHHAPAANALGYAMIVLSFVALMGMQQLKKPRALPSARSVFTLVVTPTTLSQLADGTLVAEIALTDIADVTNTGDAVVIVRRDASQMRLIAPPSSAVELAGDVDARIREMRALHAGYR
jgi:hypothetical protein